MSKNSKNEDIVQHELDALNNFASALGLTAHVYYDFDHRKKQKYFVGDKFGVTISPVLDYMNMNHFLLGFQKGITITQKQSHEQ